MLIQKQIRYFFLVLILPCAYAQSRRLPLEKVTSNGKCEGKLLKAVNVSTFSCMSSCDAEPKCDIANIMDEQGRCELLSNDASLLVEAKQAEGWSCYNKPKMDFCQVAKDPAVVFPCCVLGTSRCVPARSCLHLTTTCPSYAFESGLYWIQGPLNAIQMYCEMETYGGGWTKVANVDTTSGNRPIPTTYTYDDINALAGANSSLFRLTTYGLKELRRLIEFTQLRVFCYKSSVNRTVHIATTKSTLGYAVVDYMSGLSDVRPAACNSFTILAEDTSLLSRRCSQWGYGGWSHGSSQYYDRLYDATGYIPGSIHIVAACWNRYECDDAQGGDLRGTWTYFVR